MENKHTRINTIIKRDIFTLYIVQQSRVMQMKHVQKLIHKISDYTEQF